MGLFVEDLLNFGNLMDAEIEIKLTEDILKKAYPNLTFELGDGLLRIYVERRGLIFKKRHELRLLEDARNVKSNRDEGRRYIFMKALVKDIPEDMLKGEEFLKDGEYLGMDVWPCVKLTEVYDKIPRQFKERLTITRYKVKKDGLSVFLRVEK
ncbi:conserved hypothetical protein [Hydrogenobacter thermophilus TK-6]|uniref:Uncharacterized protein n=1 Tax=Hydrogenobacter thermophilus (strain DSM 6534 / IAM 12695 / TK-6) TaxID=608538 RepID=D3DJS5_HYDTT|nr:hypothetical protein [Hydrogenobacter thermophilus]ADO46000.1 conserved hypothetical protein [Hydrogenobacter thermophilus TK-6]BAI70077.1 hypothetical protein HTH_1629 [Hydrogenobacter thermophilus TK-6]